MSAASSIIVIAVTAWLLLATPISLLRRIGKHDARSDRFGVVTQGLGYLGALLVVRILVPPNSPIIVGLWAIALVLAAATAVGVALRWHALPKTAQASWPRVRLAGNVGLLAAVAAIIAAPVALG